MAGKRAAIRDPVMAPCHTRFGMPFCRLSLRDIAESW